MYFIKYHPLKEKLRERSLTEREALPYLIIFAASTSLPLLLPVIGEYNKWDGLQGIFSLLTTIVGTIYVYGENGGATGYDIINKYVVLGWVVLVRLVLALIPAMLLLYIVGEWLGVNSAEDVTGPYDVLISFIFGVIYFQRLGRHIKDTKIEAS